MSFLLVVTSRTIISTFFEQIRVGLMPLLHFLHRCSAVQCRLEWLLIVQRHISCQCLFKILAAVEATSLEHISDASIEAFHHAVGFGRPETSQAMFDAQFPAQLIEFMWPLERFPIFESRHRLSSIGIFLQGCWV